MTRTYFFTIVDNYWIIITAGNESCSIVGEIWQKKRMLFGAFLYIYSLSNHNLQKAFRRKVRKRNQIEINTYNSYSSTVRLHKFVYTGCEGYCRPFFKMVSCINCLSDHDKIFTVYPLLHLLLSSDVHLLARLKGPRQENQRAVIVKIIRAVWGKMENEKFKK